MFLKNTFILTIPTNIPYLLSNLYMQILLRICGYLSQVITYIGVRSS